MAELSRLSVPIGFFTYATNQLNAGEPIVFDYLTVKRGIKTQKLYNYDIGNNGVVDLNVGFVYKFEKISAFADNVQSKPLGSNVYLVYVLEVDEDPNRVYVGQTSNSREYRLQQHIMHYKSAFSLRHAKTLTLRSDLYVGMPPVNTEKASLSQESLLAANLRARGFIVLGGH